MREYMKPNLIDGYSDTQSEVLPGKWCIAKPLTLFGFERIRQNIYHAWLVLWGKATAVSFGIDQLPVNLSVKLKNPEGK